MQRRVFKLVSVLFVLAVFFVFIEPTANAGLISTKEEISIGQDVAKQLEKKYGLVEDEELANRVVNIGAKLVEVCDRKDIPWTFKVLNIKEVNAVSLPGGPVYVYKGLIDYMPSDEELAGVLAHEVGHIVKRHSVKQMEKSMKMGILFGAVFGDRGIFLQNLAYNAIMAGYSREDEREADYLGYIYSSKAGYNPYSLLIGMKKLAELSGTAKYGLFSDHPEPEARIKLLNTYLQNNNVTPKVTEHKDGAVVSEGGWSFTITNNYKNYKPAYRAYFLAGTLYRISAGGPVNADYFYTTEDYDEVKIYYDDTFVYSITQEDAVKEGMTKAELSEKVLYLLRDWAQLKK